MLTTIRRLAPVLALCAAFTVRAATTAFIQQGQLWENTTPATGTYDFHFTLYDSPTNGTTLAGPVTNNAVAVVNGTYYVVLDFGPGVFHGNPTWLQVDVSTNGAGVYTPLEPRDVLMPVPMALYAPVAGSATSITGPITGNGAGLTNLTASALAGTIPSANLPGLLPTLAGRNGASLTNLNPNNISYLGLSLGSPYNEWLSYPPLPATTSGYQLTAFGVGALSSNSTGFANTGIGDNALHLNTTGAFNTALGSVALNFNTVGMENTALGEGALYLNTIGSHNSAVGCNSLRDAAVASFNDAFGEASQQYQTNGEYNSSFGGYTLFNNTNGGYGTAVGFSALYSSQGEGNVAVGAYAGGGWGGKATPSVLDSYCVFIGENAGRDPSVPAATYLTNAMAFGNNATVYSNNTVNFGGHGQWAVTVTAPKFIGAFCGDGSLITNLAGMTGYSSRSNTVFGASALPNTTGTYDSAFGYQALYMNTNGSDNTAVGYRAMYQSQSAHDNTAVGMNALANNATGAYNVALGEQALYSSTGNYNTAVGQSAASSTTSGSSVTAVGYKAAYQNQTNYTTAVGFESLQNNTTGFGATAVGANALLAATNANASTAVGLDAGMYSVAGTNNTSIGAYTGQYNTNGGNNTFVGAYAGSRSQGGDAVIVGGKICPAGTNSTGLVALGAYALGGSQSTNPAASIALGYYAGYYNTNANTGIIDNRARASFADEMTNAPFYWTMGASSAAQTINLNATVSIAQGTIYRQISSPPTAAQIGGVVGSVTNHWMGCVNGVLLDYWSDGATLYGPVKIAPVP